MVSEIPEAVFSTLEKNLEQNEAQYRQLINALPDLLYSYSLSQGGIFFSPAAFTMLGYTPDYLLEHPFCWKESIHPDDQPVVYNAVRDFLLGKPFDLVYRIRHANGHWVWLRDRSISCSEQGDDFIIQGIASDITEEKLKRQQEEQYLAMLSCISDVVAVVDGNGTITFISSSVTARFGWQADDLLQTRGWDLVHPDDIASAMARFFNLLDQGEQAYDCVEIRIRCKDKSYLPVRLSGTNQLHNPDVQGILLSFYDISTEKRALSEQMQSESRFRSIIDCCPMGIYLYRLNPDGSLVLTSANPAADRIIGISHAPLLNRTLEEAFPGLATTFVPQLYQQVIHGEIGPQEFELPYQHQQISGYFKVHVFKVDTDCIAVMFFNIADQKQTETELIEARTLAEEANRFKNRFLTTIGHELRTPLNSVLCMTQTLRFNNLTPEQQTVIELIEHSIGHLDELVVDITNLSKLEEGVLQLEQNEFSLHKLLNDIHASQMPRLHAKNITLRTSITDDTPDLLTGDLLRIKLILQNLLTNAIACSKAGTVTIAVSSFQTDHQPPSVIFCVQDHRTPLSAEALGSIFEPFQDAGQAGKHATGLGLTISRKLAGIMGGILLAEKAGDGSTRFNLQIPAVLHQHTGTDTP